MTMRDSARLVATLECAWLFANGLIWRRRPVLQWDDCWMAGAQTTAWALVIFGPLAIFGAGLAVGLHIR
jgi:hypothetical protein